MHLVTDPFIVRKVSRIGREVLDAVAAEVRPGVSTDYLDQICHQACIDRDVRIALPPIPSTPSRLELRLNHWTVLPVPFKLQ